MRHDEYVQYDAVGLAKLIDKGDVTAEDVLQAAIARRNAVNPSLNAVVDSWDDEARRNTPGLSGPLGGVQIAARMGEEPLLLQLAAQIEQAQPWAHLLPTSGSV
jgi:amidase